MLEKITKGVAALFAVALLLTGVRWQIDPAVAAGNLHMPLLEGAARSTQIGDLSSFFVTAGVLAMAGVLTRNAALMIAPAMLVGCAAVFRTLAWALHGAELTLDLIVVELLMCVAFLLAWYRMSPANTIR